MYLVKYKAISSCNELHGFVCYYADPEDALNTGMLCEKVVVWEDNAQYSEYMFDFCGNKRFRKATDQEIDEFA